MNKFIVLLVISSILSCSSINQLNKNTPLVSMIRLISNPEKYHKKEIDVQGYYTIQFEERAIYFNEAEYKIGNSSNAILLDVSNEFLKTQNIEPPYKGYVSIRGVFYNEGYRGNNRFNGILKNITFIDRIEKRDDGNN